MPWNRSRFGLLKEVEGLRLVAGSPSSPRWPPEAHQPRFLGIDLQAVYHSILHPTAQKFPHLPMIDCVEELAQIHLKNPLHFLSKALFSQVRLPHQ